MKEPYILHRQSLIRSWHGRIIAGKRGWLYVGSIRAWMEFTSRIVVVLILVVNWEFIGAM
jgi:hypothetical protein